jgi:teichuronic acid biosynthesis glycosyltransferase TuaG
LPNIAESRSIIAVSVIIPYYNSSLTIRRALESVFSQTSLPAEIVIVDDRSSDHELNSLKAIIKEFCANSVGVRIVLLSLDTNSGPSAARNAGWNSSTQPYLAFLDADDSWFRNKLALQYDWMNSNPDAVLSAHECTLSELAGSCVLGDVNVEVRRITKWQILFSSFFSTPSVMLRRNLPFRFDNSMRYSEDHYLWMLVILSNKPSFFFKSAYAAIHKPAFGSSGLSSSLWNMEKGELITYWKLYTGRLIGAIYLAGFSIFSILKYFRRLLILWIRR